MANIEFSNESQDEIELSDFEGLISSVFDAMYLSPETEIGLTFVDKEEIRQLNKEWLQSDYPTDVLSFPMDELRPGTVGEDHDGGMLGDLIICPAIAAEQASLRNHSVLSEMQMLTVHGILHLLGFDHAQPDDEKEMFELQNRLIRVWAEENNQPWVEHFGASTIDQYENNYEQTKNKQQTERKLKDNPN